MMGFYIYCVAYGVIILIAISVCAKGQKFVALALHVDSLVIAVSICVIIASLVWLVLGSAYRWGSKGRVAACSRCSQDE